METMIDKILALIVFGIGIVGCFGYAFYFIVLMLKKSNDYGSENEITDFSSKGFEDLYFDPNVDPALTMEMPDWMKAEDDVLDNGGWRCKNCQKVNQSFIYVCSCGKTKKENESSKDMPMD
ncbi:MAG: hypothetical protein IK081_04295 [Lachnospiraceae bacterium]|nr:hypothetical protein [Lachnospiraceae bacterium]